MPLAPDEAAGGAGYAWVTGDAPVSSSITEHDCDGPNQLWSPSWNATGGATILSFDYWSTVIGGIKVRIDNGAGTVDVKPVEFQTIQTFDAPSRYSWQRTELNLADHVAPTSNMRVAFIGEPNGGVNELGVDNVRVEAATACSRSALAIESTVVDDSPAGWGNGNGLLEPGETAYLHITLRNNGSSTAFSPAGIAFSSTSGVLVHDAVSSWPDVSPGSTAPPGDDGFVVSLPHGMTCGDTLVVEFEFIDAAGTLSREIWNPETGDRVTDLILEDTFESDLGWTTDGPDPGGGVWERGDPVGTKEGSLQANPENDSPNDAGSQCYVTENGPPGGDENAHDVDAVHSILFSPLLDFSGYKRASHSFDLWYHDSATMDPSENYFGFAVKVEGDDSGYLFRYWKDTRNGYWETVNLDLTESVPMIANVRLVYLAVDQDAATYPWYQDHVVEAGIDNVRVEADRQHCDLSSIDPPNPVGNTLLVAKSGADAELAWQVPASDASHDPAAYYQVHVSSHPEDGFSVESSTRETTSLRPLDGAGEYYKLVSINAAGSSGEEPLP
jgi:hypothetical protein